MTGPLTIWFQLHRSMALADLQRTAEPAWQRVLIAARSMCCYLGKAVAPVRLSMISSALHRTPDPKDFNNYGVVLLQLGETESAREQFLSAARLEPSMLSPHLNLYNIACAQNNAAAANDELRTCLRIDAATTAARLQTRESDHLR